MNVITVGSYSNDVIVDCKVVKRSLDDIPEEVTKAIVLVVLAVGSHLMTVGESRCLVSPNEPGDTGSKWKPTG